MKFPPITIIDVPVLRAGGALDQDFGYICSEYIPPSAAKWAKPGNVNIAVTFGIVISATIDSANQKLTLTIDASAAHKPEGSPYSIKQVVDAVEKCVRLMEPQILPAYKKTVVRKLAAP
ncbi:hypothetical protein [Prosthecobacter vanneervenii]|uniref:Uncharacterized protein n=1 Tax=Prosthecobacter vanneervenii TaxID=48466 RepID=A0A7W7YGE1_9BACT|nr:hypothetical protein [Prosthecobacter vanneervenii]MBB5035654.1 hypothetical protein [Prosthecobacter vanneervenii]